MKLTNVRYMTYKVGAYKLKKGRSMEINNSMITSRLQSLINRGYFSLEAVEAPVSLTKNSEPDENLPDTDPAPEVPPAHLQSPPPLEEKTAAVEIKEAQPVASKEVKPKITKRRRKKPQAKSAE